MFYGKSKVIENENFLRVGEGASLREKKNYRKKRNSEVEKFICFKVR